MFLNIRHLKVNYIVSIALLINQILPIPVTTATSTETSSTSSSALLFLFVLPRFVSLSHFIYFLRYFLK